MAERWFLALWPDAPTRDALADCTAGVLPETARPAHPADLHLTLVFLGEVTPGQVACVESVAAQVRAPCFELSMDRIGHFRYSRVLWCGPSRTPPALQDLVGVLQTGLLDCGIQPERRPYRPHLTLARKVSERIEQRLPEPVPWRVRELVLAYGRDGARPRYRVHRRWPLIGPDG